MTRKGGKGYFGRGWVGRCVSRCSQVRSSRAGEVQQGEVMSVTVGRGEVRRDKAGEERASLLVKQVLDRIGRGVAVPTAIVQVWESRNGTVPRRLRDDLAQLGLSTLVHNALAKTRRPSETELIAINVVGSPPLPPQPIEVRLRLETITYQAADGTMK